MGPGPGLGKGGMGPMPGGEAKSRASGLFLYTDTAYIIHYIQYI